MLVQRRFICLLEQCVGFGIRSRQTKSRWFRSPTLEVAIQELRKQGRLPNAEQYQRSSPIFKDAEVIDIDADIVFETSAETSAQEDFVENIDGKTAIYEDLDENDDVNDHVCFHAPARDELATGKDQSLEDVALIPEEELRERVRRSIEELVPPSMSAGTETSDVGNTTSLSGLTPAQIFFMENKDRLVNRAQEYYLEKQLEQQLQQNAVENIEDEWRFYHDPVVRPRKGHLWSTGEDDNEHGLEQGWLETVSAWPKGVLPTADMLAQLLRGEQAKDVHVVDLHACGRHDVGTHGIVATGITTGHCRRLGEIAAKATQSCEVPHVEAFCYGTRNDEWVVAHCGSIKVHLLTRESRQNYRIEDLWERPEDFFAIDDFPHYVAVYGSASDAPPEGHITDPTGSRSRSQLPPPFPDQVHSILANPDYDAAADAQFTTQANVPAHIDVTAIRDRREFGDEGEETSYETSDTSATWNSTEIREQERSPHEAVGPISRDQALDAEADTDDEDEDWPSVRKDSIGETKPLHRL